MTPGEAQAALLAAISAADVRTFDDPGGAIVPPGAVVGPPTLTYDVYDSSTPTEGVFAVFAVVPADERASEHLLALLPIVVGAIEGAEVDGVSAQAVVRTAAPGSFATGQTILPCYNIRVEVAL